MNKGCAETMAKAMQTSCMARQFNQNQKNGKYKGCVEILEPSLRMSKEEFSQFKKARKYRCIKRSSSGRFGASICDPIAQKRWWLGSFNTPDEAKAAYISAAKTITKNLMQHKDDSNSYIEETDRRTSPCYHNSDSGFKQIVIKSEMSDTCSHNDINNRNTNNLDDDVLWEHTEKMIESIYRGLYFKVD